MNALRVNAQGAQPFTKNDVVNYFQSHNLPKNQGLSTQFQVETLEFLTNNEVSLRLAGASPGLAPNEKVGFATLRGTFIASGPLGGSGFGFSRAYAVFDTKTGNLLMSGALEQEAPPRPR